MRLLTHLTRRPKFWTVTAIFMAAAVAVIGVKILSCGRATSPAPSGMREVPDPLYGVTVDSVANTANITASSRALPRKPTTRIVFDEGVPASDYASAVDAIQPDSYIMGELVDSSGLAKITPTQFHDRTAEYLEALGDKVDIWEVGNEVNGSWTGPYASVGVKILDAHNQVKAAGKRSALTLWYNPGCPGIPSAIDPIAFSKQYVPAEMRSGLDYVFVSYYEVECNNYRPSAAEITATFSDLHALYPNSKLGFGEVGLVNPASAATQATADSILKYYYGLHINVPGYVGGYFWWNYYEDMLPNTKPMWQQLSTAFTTVTAAPVTTSPTPTPTLSPIVNATANPAKAADMNHINVDYVLDYPHGALWPRQPHRVPRPAISSSCLTAGRAAPVAPS